MATNNEHRSDELTAGVETSKKRSRMDDNDDATPSQKRDGETPGHVFIFDYDHTIVSENSDTHIPELLGAQAAMRLIKEYRGDQGWTALMDSVVLACQEEDAKSIEEIASMAGEVPCFPEMINVLQLVAEQGPVHIVSDANSLFIQSFVDRHKIRVDTVHTNPAARDEKGRLRVTPHAQVPHGCQRCPKNMCKSAIVTEKIISRFTESRPRIVYFGDGSNDFCPVLNVLSEHDIVFARDDADESRARGLVKKIDADPSKIRAQVVRWARGKDLLGLVKRHLL